MRGPYDAPGKCLAAAGPLLVASQTRDPVRTLALVILTFNITWAAPWTVLVLWALDRVGIDEAGFGLLTSAAALGGVLGTFCYGRLERSCPSRCRCAWRC